MRDLGIEGRIILKLELKFQRVWTRLVLRIDSFELDDEPSGYTEGE